MIRAESLPFSNMDMAIHVNIYEDVHGEVQNCNQLVSEQLCSRSN